MILIPDWPSPSDDDVALFRNAYTAWSQGNQEVALAQLRTRAESGPAWVHSLIAWLTMQQGYPGIEESVTSAIRAARSGYPGQLLHTFNNVLANLTSHPQLANRLPEILATGVPWNVGQDLVGQAWNLMSMGQAEVATQLVSIPFPGPTQLLQPIVDAANDRLSAIEATTSSVAQRAETVSAAATQAESDIEKARDDLETSARQASLLVSTVSSDATNSLFKADAVRNAKDSKIAWISGLTVLGAAAIVAVAPVLLHYGGVGPEYTSFEQIGLHLVSTAALATFAGVLLARSRSRDHAAQRAHDLSTAMGTMISYSNQISDPAERQRFMTVMGQVVLQSHLTAGPKQGGDESVSGMLALASLLKPGGMPPTTT